MIELFTRLYNRYAEKMKLPNLDYVTLPRLGAIQTIIKTLGDSASGKLKK